MYISILDTITLRFQEINIFISPRLEHERTNITILVNVLLKFHKI